MEKTEQLDAFITKEANILRSVNFTGYIDEDYLKNICEKYYELKNS